MGMDKLVLAGYAKSRIERLRLGEGGPLGTEYLCVYTDIGPDAIRLSDGHHTDVCRTVPEIDRSLEGWVDWIEEG